MSSLAPALTQATIFLAAAIICVPICKRLGLPSVIGYLFTGVLLGPFCFNLSGDTKAITEFAEYGVVFFLFLVGLELQPKRLWALRRPIFLLGSLQMGLTGLGIMWFIYTFTTMDLRTSYIIGFGLALSSTAFVLQLLAERSQLNSAHGRKAFAVLLFQDIAIIPILATLPFLAGEQKTTLHMSYFVLVLLSFTGMILFSHYVFRPVFRFIAKSNVPELLTATALLIVMGVTLVMHSLDISLTLGAFLAGVLLAESEYRHELEASILPFKGLLLGLFFIAVGMSAQLDLLFTEPVLIILGALGLVAFKFLVMVGIARVLKNSWGVSLRLGVALAQGGEFAFVLFNSALQVNLMSAGEVEPLILMVTLSMIFTPILFYIQDRYVEPRLAEKWTQKEFDQIPDHSPQVIVAGFGRIGQIVARVLRMHSINFTAIDHRIHQVDVVRKFGNKVYYGESSHPETLRAAGIEHVKLFILTVDDVAESVKTAAYLRRAYPDLIVYARARDRHHLHLLREVGVTHVWRETFMTSLDLSKHMLMALGMKSSDAQQSIHVFRKYDEKLLDKQQAIFDDELQLIESVKASSLVLENLFDSDLNKFNKTPPKV